MQKCKVNFNQMTTAEIQNVISSAESVIKDRNGADDNPIIEKLKSDGWDIRRYLSRGGKQTTINATKGCYGIKTTIKHTKYPIVLAITNGKPMLTYRGTYGNNDVRDIFKSHDLDEILSFIQNPQFTMNDGIKMLENSGCTNIVDCGFDIDCFISGVKLRVSLCEDGWIIVYKETPHPNTTARVIKSYWEIPLKSDTILGNKIKCDGEILTIVNGKVSECMTDPSLEPYIRIVVGTMGTIYGLVKDKSAILYDYHGGQIGITVRITDEHVKIIQKAMKKTREDD